jgi:hypothetical protein
MNTFMSRFYRRGSILERRLCVHLDGASAFAVSGARRPSSPVSAEPPQIPGTGLLPNQNATRTRYWACDQNTLTQLSFVSTSSLLLASGLKRLSRSFCVIHPKHRP